MHARRPWRCVIALRCDGPARYWTSRTHPHKANVGNLLLRRHSLVRVVKFWLSRPGSPNSRKFPPTKNHMKKGNGSTADPRNPTCLHQCTAFPIVRPVLHASLQQSRLNHAKRSPEHEVLLEGVKSLRLAKNKGLRIGETHSANFNSSQPLSYRSLTPSSLSEL